MSTLSAAAFSVLDCIHCNSLYSCSLVSLPRVVVSSPFVENMTIGAPWSLHFVFEVWFTKTSPRKKRIEPGLGRYTIFSTDNTHSQPSIVHVLPCCSWMSALSLWDWLLYCVTYSCHWSVAFSIYIGVRPLSRLFRADATFRRERTSF